MGVKYESPVARQKTLFMREITSYVETARNLGTDKVLFWRPDYVNYVGATVPLHSDFPYGWIIKNQRDMYIAGGWKSSVATDECLLDSSVKVYRGIQKIMGCSDTELPYVYLTLGLQELDLRSSLPEWVGEKCGLYPGEVNKRWNSLALPPHFGMTDGVCFEVLRQPAQSALGLYASRSSVEKVRGIVEKLISCVTVGLYNLKSESIIYRF